MEPRTPRPASARTTTCIAVPDLLLGLSKLTKVCAAPPLGCDAGGGGCAKLPGSVNAGGYDEKLVVPILLEAVGALRSAYVKLQRAHVPYYDPAKIAVADEAVAAELDYVAALQCLCSSTSGGGGGVAKLVDERWSLVQRLEGETRKREPDIVVLRRELEGLRRASSRLGKQIRMSRASVWHGKVAVLRRELTTTTAATSLGAVLELFMAAAAAVHGLVELISASFAAAAASSSDC